MVISEPASQERDSAPQHRSETQGQGHDPRLESDDERTETESESDSPTTTQGARGQQNGVRPGQQAMGTDAEIHDQAKRSNPNEATDGANGGGPGARTASRRGKGGHGVGSRGGRGGRNARQGTENTGRNGADAQPSEAGDVVHARSSGRGRRGARHGRGARRGRGPGEGGRGGRPPGQDGTAGGPEPVVVQAGGEASVPEGSPAADFRATSGGANADPASNRANESVADRRWRTAVLELTANVNEDTPGKYLRGLRAFKAFGEERGWDVEDGAWAPIPSEHILTSVYDKFSTHYADRSRDGDEDLPDWARGARITHDRMEWFVETLADETFSKIENCLKGIQFYSRVQALLEGKPHESIRDNMAVRAHQRAAKRGEAAKIRRNVMDRQAKTLTDGYTEEQKEAIADLFKRDVNDNPTDYVKLTVGNIFNVCHQNICRGNDARRITLPDLFAVDRKVVGPDKCMMLGIVSRQGKTNQNGNTEYMGAVRHKFPKHCAVGSIAQQLFTIFHILENEAPDFSSREAWYNEHYLFFDKDDPAEQLDYQTHRAGYRDNFRRNNVVSTSVTHACRESAPKHAKEGGANTDEAKTLGRWDRDHYHMSYDTILPAGILLVQACFRDNKDTYVLPRSRVKPPPALLKKLWPWAEKALAEVMDRNVRGPAKDRDIAAQRFLEALIWLRAVLCQDIALLQIEYPEHPVCANHLFSGRAWKQFQKDVLAACTEEQENPFRLTSLPPDVVELLSGQHAAIARLESQQASMKFLLEDLVSRLSCGPLHPARRGAYVPDGALGFGFFETFPDRAPPARGPRATEKRPKAKRPPRRAQAAAPASQPYQPDGPASKDARPGQAVPPTAANPGVSSAGGAPSAWASSGSAVSRAPGLATTGASTGASSNPPGVPTGSPVAPTAPGAANRGSTTAAAPTEPFAEASATPAGASNETFANGMTPGGAATDAPTTTAAVAGTSNRASATPASRGAAPPTVSGAAAGDSPGEGPQTPEPQTPDHLPSTGAPATSPAAGVPKYRMRRDIGTILDVWIEYAEGLDGQPAVKTLKRKYGNQWHPAKTERQWYSKRARIYDKVEQLKNSSGKSCIEVARELDRQREAAGETLAAFMESLAKKKFPDNSA